MSELVLELSLKRSSGVLAGIVAALGQAGVHLQTQKLDRSGTGWLTIHAESETPDPVALTDRLNGTRGVDRLVRLSIDGETVIEDGAPVAPASAETESDPIRAEDLAELSAGAARGAVPDEADETRAIDEVAAFIDDTDAAEPPTSSSASPEDAPPENRTRDDEPPRPRDIQTEALDAEITDAPAAESERPWEAAAEPMTQSAGDERSGESADAPSGDDDSHSAPAALGNEERVKLNLRRRRRRRR